MAQLFEFLGNHPALTLAFATVLGLLIWTFVVGGITGGQKVSPSDATQLLNHEDAIVIDIRGEGEFNQGHILNSLHVPLKELSNKLDALRKHKARPIIAACRSGQQATGACATLRKNGFEKVYALRGGILAWEGDNLPLTKK